MSEPIHGTTEWRARSEWAAASLMPEDKSDEASAARMYRVMELMGLHYGYEIEVSMLREQGTGQPTWQVIQRSQREDPRRVLAAFVVGAVSGVLVMGLVSAIVIWVGT